EGSSGLLTRGLSSCLQYYRDVGRPWERQMLTKARVISEAGGAGAAFLAGTHEWILRCGMDAGAIRQFKRLQAATEAHHATAEGASGAALGVAPGAAAEAAPDAANGGRADVKQAPGGIRDIETIVQFLALLHAAHNPALVSRSTLLG